MTLQQPQLLRQTSAADLPLMYRGEVRYMSHVEPESEEGWRRATDRHLEFWVANLPRTVVLEVASIPVGYAMWADIGGALTLRRVGSDAEYLLYERDLRTNADTETGPDETGSIGVPTVKGQPRKDK
jgi:hypothetical protein